MLSQKLETLDKILHDLKSFVVAFSGGVDSTFVLHRAAKNKKLNFTAVTIRTSYIPAREIEEAVDFCNTYGIKHSILDISFPEAIRHNPVERCYMCKKLLFSHIRGFADKNGYLHIVDGSNSDDNGEFRPGLRALKELDVKSPLMEANLLKSEIREASKSDGLSTWDKPAYACLLTRIPYGTRITERDLKMIEEAEQYLFDQGFYGTRVRLHGDVARIECMPGYLSKFVSDPHRTNVINRLKEIGFRFISLDLEGYKTGSLNPENDKK